VLLASVPVFCLLSVGFFVYLLKVDKLRGALMMYQADVAIATIVYGTQQRTLSGICGKNKKAGVGHYRVIANFINRLASLVGDGPLHCERADDWEIKNGLDY